MTCRRQQCPTIRLIAEEHSACEGYHLPCSSKLKTAFFAHGSMREKCSEAFFLFISGGEQCSYEWIELRCNCSLKPLEHQLRNEGEAIQITQATSTYAIEYGFISHTLPRISPAVVNTLSEANET